MDYLSKGFVMDLSQGITLLRELTFNVYYIMGFSLIPFMAIYCNSLSSSDKEMARWILWILYALLFLLLIGKLLVDLTAAPQPELQRFLFVIACVFPLLNAFFITNDVSIGAPSAGVGVSGAGEDTKLFRPVDLKRVASINWDDLIINDSLKQEFINIIKLLKNPKISKKIGINVPKGILLQGSPGNGKTMIAKVIAKTAGLSFFVLKFDEIISKYVGESEQNLSNFFAAAQMNKPAVIFIDEIETIARTRGEGGASHEESFLNHLLQLMDGMFMADGIYIIGATNRAELVDPALKRPGRLSKVIEIPKPDLKSRLALFTLYLKKTQLAEDISLEKLSKSTQGASGAEIKGICNQAGLNAFNRAEKSTQGKKDYRITVQDFHDAIEMLLGEDSKGTVAVDNKFKPIQLKGIVELNWDDIIISDELKKEFKSIIKLLKNPEIATQYGIDLPKGILLTGPPGNGKTTIAKIIARTAELSFFVVKTNEILSKYVGQSEDNLSMLFAAAQKSIPSIIFIDEIEAIGRSRGSGGSEHGESFLNHLLQLMDGIFSSAGIYIIGATNRDELVDAALKRPGRLSKVIEVPRPDKIARKSLFKLYLGKIKLTESVNLAVLAERTDGLSAADIQGICNQAGLNAFQREQSQPEGTRDYRVSLDDLSTAVVERLEITQRQDDNQV